MVTIFQMENGRWRIIFNGRDDIQQIIGPDEGFESWEAANVYRQLHFTKTNANRKRGYGEEEHEPA